MRALLRADRADDELARALARAGLYVERLEDPSDVRERLERGDVAVIDPRLLASPVAEVQEAPARTAERSLEELCYERLSEVLARLGDQRLPDLHATVLAQVERALLRLATERKSALRDAAELLGIHRNTLARRLDELGLRRRKDAR